MKGKRERGKMELALPFFIVALSVTLFTILPLLLATGILALAGLWLSKRRRP